MITAAYKRIYFIGIGGIGMSALARYFNGSGVAVFGYDRVETALTKKLSEEGMQIHYQDDITQIPEGIDLVIYTPAIPESHNELNYFKNNGYTIAKRAEVLGWISKDKKAIGVAGTHGKTTTSAILTHILKTAGIDCTAFLGGIAANFESNFISGQSEWVVMEADEYDRSFLHLYPSIAVITSMDADHLDVYGNVESMHSSFNEFAHQVSDTVICHNHLPLQKETAKADFVSYGVEQGVAKATNIRAKAPNFVFDWYWEEDLISNIKFTLPGIHNVLNATAAITVARKLGATKQQILTAMASFKGIKRRFEFIIDEKSLTYIDDYAHHPEELNMAIAAARQLYPDRKITAVFQPHLYSRTQDFAEGFAQALDQLDALILLDIYPAREAPIKGVSSAIIFDRMQLKEKQLISKSALLHSIENNKHEVFLTLGAGDIGAMVEDIKTVLMQQIKAESN